MNKAFADVREFEERMAAGSPVKQSFADVVTLRRTLIEEEAGETQDALWDLWGHAKLDGVLPAEELAQVADGLADLIWVCVGTAVSLGIDLPAVWEEVRRTNMAKFAEGHSFRADGKLLKPPDWTPPDILGVIERSNA